MGSCTVVSLVPFAIPNIHKPGLVPAYFSIPSAEKEIVLFPVADGARGQYLVDQDKWIELVVSAETIAKSLVFDYIMEQICIVPNEAEPAIFWVPGNFTDVAKFSKEFAGNIELAKKRQREWFLRLVQVADDDFKRTGQSRSVTDLQRYAARELGLTREWITNDPGMITRCKSCYSLVSTEAAICFACHAILNRAKYDTFEFAGGPSKSPAAV